MRNLSPGFRRAAEEPRSDIYAVILLRITHPTLTFPILVANDTINYVHDGETYQGFPFELELIGDTNQVPRGQLRIQNVDRRIGEAVVNLTTPPGLSIIIMASTDFEEAATAPDGRLENVRYEKENVTPEYEANHLVLGNVTVDAISVTAEVLSFDMSNEPWPAVRSTADRLPGLDP